MPINSSNLPTSHQFKYESYKDAPEFFKQFLSELNLFVDPVYTLLNGGVTYQNLTIPRIFTKVITAPSSGNTTFSFVNPLRIYPSAVLPGNIYIQGNPSLHPTNAVGVYWHFSEGSIYIDNITSLTASTIYSVTLVVL